MSKNRFPSVPIIALVVIANHATIIKASSHRVTEKVVHAATIPMKIENIASMYANDKLSTSDLKRMTRVLLKNYTENPQDYLHIFEINIGDILTGVHCPQCSVLPMERKRRIWICTQCLHSAKLALMAALNDDYYLFGTKINNHQLRQFLLIKSVSVASKILASLLLEYTGTFRSREYVPFENFHYRKIGTIIKNDAYPFI